jgi:pimeloyl-ACP methyl ester carboxylesterase
MNQGDLITQGVKDEGEPQMRRWVEQRWLLDNVIAANGCDWDQPRSISMNVPCGPEAGADFAGLRQSIKRFADIGPAFAKIAKRREEKARVAEAEGAFVSAASNFFMAAIHWGGAQWPHHGNSDANLYCHVKKRECYEKYISYADHRIEPVRIPFQNAELRGWLHFPPQYSGGRVPVVISVPGLDSFKEMFVSLYGDRWLSRGLAVLALDGPGQAESRTLGTVVSMENLQRFATNVVDWLEAHPQVDANRVGLFGNSFGSFVGTIAAANEPRLKATAVMSICLEPRFNRLLGEASPTFKKRFMYMTGCYEEAAFDRMMTQFTWEGQVEKIKTPYLCLSGEHDELSDVSNAYRMFERMAAPRRLVIYEGCSHAVGYVQSTNIGPYPSALVGDWMAGALAGRSFPSEAWFVHADGSIVKTPY